MSRSPAFQFYPGDFLSDSTVQAATNEELGIYIKLLCHDWMEGGLPTDMGLLARMVGVTQAELEKAWKIIGRKFKKTGGKNPRFRNSRLQREKKAQLLRKKHYSEAGKRGAEKRWTDSTLDGKRHGKAIARPMAKNSSSSSSSSSSSLITPLSPPLDSAFAERFWPVYPRKVSRASALKAFKKLAPKNGLLEVILHRLAEQVSAYQQRHGADWQFFPHAATWLNQRRWEDEVNTSAAGGLWMKYLTEEELKR